jgi:superfamily I DNA/RNA helicase
MTFHGIKGLEYKQVFLVDVNERTCPKFPSYYHVFSDLQKEEHIKSERSLLYVAVSRAMQNVEITGVGSKSKFINL